MTTGWFVLIWFAAIQCGSSTSESTPDDGMTPDHELTADFELTPDNDPIPDSELIPDSEMPPEKPPVALCGMAGYPLLDPVADGLGQPVHHEPTALFAGLPAEVLNAMLVSAGFEALTPVPHGVSVYRFRYTTQDRGQKIESTGLIGIPRSATPPAKPWPLALFLHGFAGPDDPCAPSGTDTIGPAVTSLVAANGFITISPDYIGLNGLGAPSDVPHASLIGEQVALGSWDALRAGLTLIDGPLSTEITGERGSQLVVWGHSQGGHAALFVELFGEYYAPEFPVDAVVAASPALDLRAVIAEGMKAAVGQDLGAVTVPATVSALTLVGMRRWYEVPDSMHGVLTNNEPYFIADRAEAALVLTGDECVVQAELEADTIEDVYEPGFIQSVLAGDWSSLQPWTCFIEENSPVWATLPRLRDTPVLTVFGELDPLIIPVHQYPAFDALCDAGWTLDFFECGSAPHGESSLWSIPDQLDWLKRRLAGEPLPAGERCQRQPPVRCLGTPADVP